MMTCQTQPAPPLDVSKRRKAPEQQGSLEARSKLCENFGGRQQLSEDAHLPSNPHKLPWRDRK